MIDHRVRHFESHGDWTACDEYIPYSGLGVAATRDETTCLRCRSRFINPTDSELVVELLAEKRRWIRGEI